MTTPMINSFRLRREDDGRVTLEFGVRDQPIDSVAPPDDGASFVALHRLELSHLAAWRLAHGLSQALRRPITGRAAAPTPAQVQAPPLPPGRAGAPGSERGESDALRRRSTAPLNLPLDPMAEVADWLQAAVREMAPQHTRERSIRIAPGKLQANRFLLSISANQMPADALDRSWAICRRLGLPETVRSAVEAAFAQAHHLHFGFEGDPGRIVCKLYLERAVSGAEAAQARQDGVAAPQYTAFKWDTATGAHVVSRYDWHPGLSVEAIAERMAAQFDGPHETLLAQARSVLMRAAERLAPERLLYLEVTEAGQPRRSFDLNVYDAKLQVRDLQAELFALRDQFAIGPSRFQALYDQIKGQRFGHLAGGIHRDGQPFFNVYFGAAREG
jgi:hypothetical protein